MKISRDLRKALQACLVLLIFSVARAQLKPHERYTLHSGDVIELAYRITPDLNQTVIVQPDGFISIKIGGEVHVGGLTLDQAHKAIVTSVSSDLNDPELNLILKDFARAKILIAGEVQHPGPMELREDLTVVSAILSAGGYTNDAKSGQILLFRRVDGNIVEVRTLNLTRLEKPQAREQDMALRDGDMIYITHDKATRIEHYMKVLNLGMYFNPFEIP
jgi:polysaccharide export outer membrane protein